MYISIIYLVERTCDLRGVLITICFVAFFFTLKRRSLPTCHGGLQNTKISHRFKHWPPTPTAPHQTMTPPQLSSMICHMFSQPKEAPLQRALTMRLPARRVPSTTATSCQPLTPWHTMRWTPLHWVWRQLWPASMRSLFHHTFSPPVKYVSAECRLLPSVTCACVRSMQTLQPSTDIYGTLQWGTFVLTEVYNFLISEDTKIHHAIHI